MYDVLYVGNSMVLTLEKLRDSDGKLVTDAAVSVTLFGIDGTTQVNGQSWPLTMSHQGGGSYSAVLEETIDVEEGARYVMKLSASAVQGELLIERTLKAVTRDR